VVPEANIFLVGFAACGKSTVGDFLSGKLRWPFLDTDREVEKLAGMELERMFTRYGQAHFRRLEWQVLQAIEATSRMVVAAGATVFLSAPHRRAIKERGISIWLDVPFEEIWSRLQKLGVVRLAERRRLAKTFERRRNIYALADLRVQARGLSPPQVAEKIISEL
jgi:shikimate kinase